MTKYADIEPFYEWLEDLMRLDPSNSPEYNTLRFYEIMDKLDCLPEVVRCKDCKYYYNHGVNQEYCCHRSKYGWQVFDVKFKADDFCSYGERRTE